MNFNQRSPTIKRQALHWFVHQCESKSYREHFMVGLLIVDISQQFERICLGWSTVELLLKVSTFQSNTQN